MRKIRRDLTTGKISSHIIKLAVPLILSNLFMTILELTDALFIGRLGSAALAGVSISGTILFFLATFGAGLSVGTVALIARNTGAKNYDKANEVAMQSFILGITIALILGSLGYLFSENILTALGAKGEVLNYGTGYIKILFKYIFTMFFMFLGSAVLRGSGDTKTPMYITLISVVINIILDWLLIFGKLGFPALGVKGAATATVISRGISSTILMILLIKGKHNIHIRLKSIKVSFNIISKIFKIGFPASIQMFIRSTSAIILIKIVSYFGTETIAAYGIGARIFSLFILPGFGFSDASATMVGQNFGANKISRIKKSAYISAGYYFIVLLFLSVSVFAFSKNIIMLFNTEPEVIKIGSVYLKYISVSALSLCIGLVLSRSFQGLGKSMIPMIITGITLYAVQIPLAYILSIKLKFNQTGIWTAQIVASYTQALLIFYKWHTYKFNTQQQ